MKRNIICGLVLAAVLGPQTSGSIANQLPGRAAGAARFIGHAALPATAFQAESAGPTALVADAAVSRVRIYDRPGASTPVRTMPNPTREGVLLIFGVKEQKGDWLNVMLPMRPNGSTGWISRSEVELRTVRSRISVDLSDLRLRAYVGDQLSLDVPVGIGKEATPTPLGNFYVDISFGFPNAGGAYGAHMLSVAGYSEVLTNFGGGIGQIAIHGTNNRASVGIRSSNGCLRLTNEAILQLKDLAPTGTPVEIVA